LYLYTTLIWQHFFKLLKIDFNVSSILFQVGLIAARRTGRVRGTKVIIDKEAK
jgi:hypothetical protein